MKKSLFVLGVAVAALASCTNEEVTEVAQNRAIGFNSFVGNTTKAVTETTQASMGTNFYVIGYCDGVNTIFKNELSTAVYYWEANKSYVFGAYYDGGKIENATFNYLTQKLTFPSYTVDDAKDLVVATNTRTSGAEPSTEQAVELTFKHMLSKVKFTFNTKAGDNYELKISDLKFTAVQTADGTYTGPYASADIDWTEVSEGEYVYADMPDVAVEANKYTASEEKLVIPQANTNSINVNFTATVSGHAIEGEKSATYSGTLAYADGSNEWKPGYAYNYTATIDIEDIDDSLKDKIIEFTVTGVDKWEEEIVNFTPTV